jgi:hypothetical protein
MNPLPEDSTNKVDGGGTVQNSKNSAVLVLCIVLNLLSDKYLAKGTKPYSTN